MTKRKTLQQIFIETAVSFSERATCSRKKVGGVLVRDGRIIASGYNGSPSGLPHCLDDGCLIQVRDGRESCIRTLHCEQAMISFCARKGIVVEGASIYLTLMPCYDCAKIIVNSGIKDVYYLNEYTGKNGKELLEQAGVNCKKIEMEKN